MADPTPQDTRRGALGLRSARITHSRLGSLASGNDGPANNEPSAAATRETRLVERRTADCLVRGAGLLVECYEHASAGRPHASVALGLNDAGSASGLVCA